MEVKDVVILCVASIEYLRKIVMRRSFTTVLIASLALVVGSCGFLQSKDSEKDGQEEDMELATADEQEFTELKKMALPCSKETLYSAWKHIECDDAPRKKALDYEEHSPIFFIAADLDGDGKAEVLLRGEAPYAAIYSYVNDSLHLITHVERAEIGLAITPDGVIIRNSAGNTGAAVSEFIRLKNSQIAHQGAVRETFTVKDNALVSESTKYLLLNDTALVEVSKEAYQEVAPTKEGTYLEDIDGWDDFRKP